MTAAAHDPRVLIVEDDLATRDLLAHTLRQDGYVVLEASNGEAGLRLDVILLDLVLPEQPGIEVLRVNRQQRHTRRGGERIGH